ncbi:type V CRISPR-associated protein Cas12a/Cpf1 [Peptostreptococcus equinus]|uniref:Type V CRISPR-associated protein Cas12a/Cpf1 n=1 Tax=Peptostreptococcus equinus TaxID=3003601 RepID=A0ABY7JNS4_9FIRM|nr:type V CRISPR-associated protein Cas12a/Cpf1 [Peptostreptococcus sp. CBA3647]WAW14526.1 type V CRISPR-associated protein Cas12a/Cpf1 [Peptostreptococcus sp. CBA3647]
MIRKLEKSSYESFTQLFPKQITLRNELIPMWETKDNMISMKEIEIDKNRAEDYKRIKSIIDDFYRVLINETLKESKIDWTDLSDMLRENKPDQKKMDNIKKIYRKEICDLMDSYSIVTEPKFNIIKNNDNKKSSIVKLCTGKDLIRVILPSFVDSYYEKEVAIKNKDIVNRFKDFTTYFTNFWDTRKNIFSSEDKSTAISQRIIFNFERFESNIAIYKEIKEYLAMNILHIENEFIENDILKKYEKIEQFFDLSYFNKLFIQKNIDIYNTIIGGFSPKDRNKIKGINELINEWNQVNKKNKIPKLASLYKQILSDRSSNSFILDVYDNDKDVFDEVKKYHELYVISDSDLGVNLLNVLDIIKDVSIYDLDKIYIKSSYLTKISKDIFDNFNIDESIASWNIINLALENYATKDNNILIEKIKKYKKEQKNENSNKKSSIYFSMSELDRVINEFIINNNYNIGKKYLIKDYFENLITKEDIILVTEAFNNFVNTYQSNNKIKTHEETKNMLKLYLDRLKSIENKIRYFSSNELLDLDMVFYSDINILLDNFSDFNSIYNKVRSYITKKEFADNKIKINFKSPDLLTGWAESKVQEKGGILFRKNNEYYLGILNKNKKNAYKNMKTLVDKKGEYEKMVYYLFPDAAKMIPKCSIKKNDVKNHFAKSKEDYKLKVGFSEDLIIDRKLYDLYYTQYDGKKKFQTEYLKNTGDEEGYKESLIFWIDFCKDFLSKYESTSIFDYGILKSSNEYINLADFYRDVDSVSYKIEYEKLNENDIRELVKNNEIYLFKIYNKDFSSNSKGKKNLHTMYFESIFSDLNQKNGIVKLNGNAEIFFREKQIDKEFKHSSGEYLVNKIDKNGLKIPEDLYVEIFNYVNGRIKNFSSKNAKQLYDSGDVTVKKAKYDIIKDRRYTQDKLYFHVPITINYKENSSYKLDDKVLRKIAESKSQNVIGIDRGEKNLIYISVVNPQGKILEQKSLNIIEKEIKSKDKSIISNINYKDILDKKAFDRNNERRSWDTIEKIKDLKEGYVSQVVHEICKMVIKYDAIISMEDLNIEFKNLRKKVEQQVYQKFETALIKKLNYLVFKDTDFTEPGGVLNAFQLARQVDTLKKVGKQCGIIFFVDPRNTSKVDPTSGFINRMPIKNIKNKQDKIKFIKKFEYIGYDNEKDMFYFKFNYKNFINTEVKVTDWCVYTNGIRCKYNRNTKKRIEINLTEEMKNIMNKYKIPYLDGNLIEKILEKEKSIDKIINILIELLNMRVSTDSEDYIISPVINSKGEFFDTRNQSKDSILPIDADANGAYNIALKGQILVKRIIDNKEKIITNNFNRGKDIDLIVKRNDFLDYVSKING